MVIMRKQQKKLLDAYFTNKNVAKALITYM